MELHERRAVTLDAGIEGDLRGRPGPRQVTVVARESWAEACRVLGREVAWTARRANLLVEGVTLERATGRVLRIGGVELEITGETEPCSRMDEAAAGLRAALEPEWRAGVTCRVRRAGAIATGDPVTLL
jgi:MOSC domain-containing protein YiiM